MLTSPVELAAAPGIEDPPRRSPRISIVIVSLAVIATLRVGRALVLPIVIALLLTLTLRAPVRWLQRRRIPGRLGAGLVVLGVLGAGGGAAALLASPAIEWVASAPQAIQTIQTKVRRIMRPLTALQRSADRMQQAADGPADNAPRTVRLATPGIFARVSADSLAAIPIALSVILLTYVLLANDSLARRKLARLLPGREKLDRREHLLDQIETAASRFLLTVASINIGVGALTALALWAVGVPNPLLWGAIAAVLNFVPYLGAMVTVTIIAAAALASIDSTARALLAPAAFLGIHLIESNFITPLALRRHLSLNMIAMFLGLLFFSWMWGIPGAVLAVPLTVCVKLVCDHVPSLAHVGELLDN